MKVILIRLSALFEGIKFTLILIFLLLISTFQLWDTRKKGCLQTFQNTYQVTTVCFNDTAEQIISGGIDNDIKVFISTGVYGCGQSTES